MNYFRSLLEALLSKVNHIDGRLIAITGLCITIEIFRDSYALSTASVCPIDYIGIEASRLSLLFWAGLACASVAGVLWAKEWSFGVLGALSLVLLTLDARLYSNHLFLLAIYSIFYFGKRRNDPKESRLYLFAFAVQLSLIYGISGISKINPAFLSGEILQWFWTDSSLLPRSWVSADEILPAIAATIIILEVSLAILIWFHRSYSLAICIGLMMHFGMLLTANRASLPGVTAFSLMALTAYLCIHQLHDERLLNKE